jgi:hypothetical protein
VPITLAVVAEFASQKPLQDGSDVDPQILIGTLAVVSLALAIVGGLIGGALRLRASRARRRKVVDD